MLRSILLVNRVKAFACFLIFISSLFNPVISQEKLGKPKITNYTYDNYEGDPDVNFIVEGSDGLIYFSVLDGIRIFDGVNWKRC